MLRMNQSARNGNGEQVSEDRGADTVALRLTPPATEGGTGRHGSDACWVVDGLDVTGTVVIAPSECATVLDALDLCEELRDRYRWALRVPIVRPGWVVLVVDDDGHHVRVETSH